MVSRERRGRGRIGGKRPPCPLPTSPPPPLHNPGAPAPVQWDATAFPAYLQSDDIGNPIFCADWDDALTEAERSARGGDAGASTHVPPRARPARGGAVAPDNPVWLKIR